MLAGHLLQAAKEHVRGMDRGDGDAEGGRSDVGRQLDGCGTGLLSRFDFETAPVGRDVHVKIEGAHHFGGQRDVRTLVEFAFDFDNGALAREWSEEQKARDPLGKRSGYDDPPAPRAARRDRDRRAPVRRFEPHAHLCERFEQRSDRPAAEILLRAERDRRVGERRQADHEVERRSRAADRDDLAPHVVRATRDEQRLIVDFNLRPKRAQHVHRILHVARIGETENPARTRRERRKN